MAQKRTWGEWQRWGDQGDGTYLNPVIPSDYSDIDCIRVGEDFYAISSTFQFSPGMTILHSRDLVNWRICANAVPDLTQISEALNWTQMNRPARGIWAGTLRHHNGRFYLMFGTPDEGYFMTSAPAAEGPWQPLTCLLAEPGWDDCTMAWDERGRGVFVGTHFSDGYKTYLFPLAPDCASFDRSKGVLINEGSGREASKLIRHGRWWYLIFSEHKGGVGRYVMAKRSRTLTGPYAEERQLALASPDAMEPNQGGIVEGKDGQWYFLTHHGSGDWSGRIVSLLPVTWQDGWPLIGEVLPEGIGTMQWGGRIPRAADTPAADGTDFFMAFSDDFDAPRLSPQWQWNYQPREAFYSLSERAGWLRLMAYRPLEQNRLLRAGNTLTLRTIRSEECEVTAKFDCSRATDGLRAGLCHFSDHSSAVGIVCEGDRRYLEYRHNDASLRGPQLTTSALWLRTSWGLDGRATYAYSTDGDIFHPFGEVYQMRWGHYRGDRIGLYCFNDAGESGLVDVDYVHVRISPHAPSAPSPRPSAF